MPAKNAFFMIEGGVALDLVREHIAERQRVRSESLAIIKELNAVEAYTDRFTHQVIGVQFPRGQVHPDFKQPNRHGVSYPKKKTEWEARLQALCGTKNAVQTISEAFNIPLVLRCKTSGGWGSSGIGSPFQECGFLYFSKEGPFAMWVPDVPAYVEEMERDGYWGGPCQVEEPARSFKLEFKGCQRILKEEWNLLVAQYKLDQKRRAASAPVQGVSP